MFKCLHVETGEDVIILHPRWRGKIDDLRALDHADRLVCQGCRQPVRVKAGDHRRAHFAHKHLAACSLGSETPEILAARALLYEWLLPQFGLGVTLEMMVASANLPRPVDVWVQTERGPFAYWIIENGIKLEPRAAIKAAFPDNNIAVTYVFLSTMLREENKRFDSLLLSPTERTFLLPTPFDAPGIDAPGRSLHYLNIETAALTTYRDLKLHHRPNWFEGRKKTTPLADARASMVDGGFVHPGEIETMRTRKARAQKLEQKRQQYQQREQTWAEHLSQRARGWQAPETDTTPELRCDTCGRLTRDYSYSYTNETGERVCRCRECLG